MHGKNILVPTLIAVFFLLSITFPTTNSHAIIRNTKPSIEINFQALDALRTNTPITKHKTIINNTKTPNKITKKHAPKKYYKPTIAIKPVLKPNTSPNTTIATKPTPPTRPLKSLSQYITKPVVPTTITKITPPPAAPIVKTTQPKTVPPKTITNTKPQTPSPTTIASKKPQTAKTEENQNTILSMLTGFFKDEEKNEAKTKPTTSKTTTTQPQPIQKITPPQKIVRTQQLPEIIAPPISQLPKSLPKAPSIQQAKPIIQQPKPQPPKKVSSLPNYIDPKNEKVQIILPNEVNKDEELLAPKPQNKPKEQAQIASKAQQTQQDKQKILASIKSYADKTTQQPNAKTTEPNIPAPTTVVQLNTKKPKAINQEEWTNVLQQAKQKATTKPTQKAANTTQPTPATEKPKQNTRFSIAKVSPTPTPPKQDESLIGSVMSWLPSFGETTPTTKPTTNNKPTTQPTQQPNDLKVVSLTKLKDPIQSLQESLNKRTQQQPTPQQQSASTSPQQQTIKQPLTTNANGSLLSIAYKDQEIKASQFDMERLSQIVQQIIPSDKRVKIISYAPNVKGSASAARRISLKRAIAIRSALIAAGLDSLRINVQAMGNQPNETLSSNSVSIFLLDKPQSL